MRERPLSRDELVAGEIEDVLFWSDEKMPLPLVRWLAKLVAKLRGVHDA